MPEESVLVMVYTIGVRLGSKKKKKPGGLVIFNSTRTGK